MQGPLSESFQLLIPSSCPGLDSQCWGWLARADHQIKPRYRGLASVPATHFLRRFTGCQPKGHHKTPLWVKQTHAQLLGGWLANMMHLTLRQHQRHVVSVEMKASLPEQTNHCGKRPLTHVYTDTSVDRY